jgi:Na+/H+ antiporter NhaD/arsenite permease-like protein
VTEPFVVGAVFVACLAVITTDKIDRTIVALVGAIAVIALRVVSQEEAFSLVDYNVIFLLAGMMVIANITGRTGVLQWMALRSVKMVKADPFLALVALSTITAVISAFLDNVTTVVLLVPMTLYIASVLGVSPIPYLIAEGIASNIGGTATLIGDPPNIMIGSAAGLSFVDFLVHLSPVIIVVFVGFVITSRFLLSGKLKVSHEHRKQVMMIDEEGIITDPVLLRKCGVVVGLTMVGFLLHSVVGYDSATIALAGAVALLLWSKFDVTEALREIEWTTMFFFIGLFILVGAVAKVGLIGMLARSILDVTQGDLAVTTLSILWMSAIVTAFVNNIPYTAAMIPLVQELGNSMDVGPIWWALALGACLGGNATMIAAAANVVVVNLAERSGHKIDFLTFLKYGAVATFVSMVICTVYVWVRYL